MSAANIRTNLDILRDLKKANDKVVYRMEETLGSMARCMSSDSLPYTLQLGAYQRASQRSKDLQTKIDEVEAERNVTL